MNQRRGVQQEIHEAPAQPVLDDIRLRLGGPGGIIREHPRRLELQVRPRHHVQQLDEAGHNHRLDDLDLRVLLHAQEHAELLDHADQSGGYLGTPHLDEHRQLYQGARGPSSLHDGRLAGAATKPWHGQLPHRQHVHHPLPVVDTGACRKEGPEELLRPALGVRLRVGHQRLCVETRAPCIRGPRQQQPDMEAQERGGHTRAAQRHLPAGQVLWNMDGKGKKGGGAKDESRRPWARNSGGSRST